MSQQRAPVGAEARNEEMGFDKWPEFMVLPSNKDFARGSWETSCGTKGCAYGWLCTAFDVEVPHDCALDTPRFPKMEESTAAAEFAAALIAELPAYADVAFGCGCSDCTGIARRHPTLDRLSGAFERAPLDFDFASAWKRAAAKFGYVSVGRFR